MNSGANFGKSIGSHLFEKRESFNQEIRKKKKHDILNHKRMLIMEDSSNLSNGPTFIDLSDHNELVIQKQ